MDINELLQKNDTVNNDVENEITAILSNQVQLNDANDPEEDFFNFIKKKTTSPNIEKIKKGIKKAEELNEPKKEQKKETKSSPKSATSTSTLSEVLETNEKKKIKEEFTEDEIMYVSELFIELLEYLNKLIAKKLKVEVEDTSVMQKKRLSVAASRVIAILKLRMHPVFTLLVLIGITYGFKYMKAKPIKKDIKVNIKNKNKEEKTKVIDINENKKGGVIN